jgi:hypothetical protein
MVTGICILILILSLIVVIVKRLFETKEQLLTDLRERTGRSILHELDDRELEELLKEIDHSLFIDANIIEKDRWTIWKAVK